MIEHYLFQVHPPIGNMSVFNETKYFMLLTFLELINYMNTRNQI